MNSIKWGPGGVQFGDVGFIASGLRLQNGVREKAEERREAMIRAGEGWTPLHAIAWIATRSDEIVDIVTDQLFMDLKIGPGNAAIAEKSLRLELNNNREALDYHNAHSLLLAALNTSSVSGWVGPDNNVWFGNLDITGLSCVGNHVGFKVKGQPLPAWSSVLLAPDLIKAQWPDDGADLEAAIAVQPVKHRPPPPPEAPTIQTSSTEWPLIVHVWRETGAGFWLPGNQPNWPRDRGDSIFLGRAVLMLGQAMFGDEWDDGDPARPMAWRGDQDPDRTARWARVKAVFDRLGIAGEEDNLTWRHKRPFDTTDAPEDCPIAYLRCETFEHLFYACRIDLTDPFRMNVDPYGHTHDYLYVDGDGLGELVRDAAQRNKSASSSPATKPKKAAVAPAERWSEEVMTAAIQAWAKAHGRNRERAWKDHFKALESQHGWSNQNFRDYWSTALGSSGKFGPERGAAQS